MFQSCPKIDKPTSINKFVSESLLCKCVLMAKICDLHLKFFFLRK